MVLLFKNTSVLLNIVHNTNYTQNNHATILEIVVAMDGSKGGSSVFLPQLLQNIQLWQPFFPCGIMTSF